MQEGVATHGAVIERASSGAFKKFRLISVDYLFR